MGLDFSMALLKLKEGKKMSRSGWNAPAQYIQMQVPDECSKMNLPYLFVDTANGDMVPWLASQMDLLAEDWYEVA